MTSKYEIFKKKMHVETLFEVYSEDTAKYLKYISSKNQKYKNSFKSDHPLMHHSKNKPTLTS